ncbi:MAG TPA: glycogen/starch/alpha-glucan phosphorylase [Ignavibacteria bacterium]|nr:glycogen/starch/alpha-glucan phosphorylase [Ignavibacteria bacterium]
MKFEKSLFFTEGIDIKTNLENQFLEHLEFDLVKDKSNVTKNDLLKALSLAIRDKLIRNWIRTQHEYSEDNVKKVHYLSLEFLMGSLLGNTLINLDLYDESYKMLNELGFSLEDVIESEHDMGLGNGGLGRLAACFLDSMSTLELPAYGYGIRYEYGIFEQDFENGNQIEKPDNWLKTGNPWEILRNELNYKIKYSGSVKSFIDNSGNLKFDWIPSEEINAVAYDVPVPGYKNNTVNNLRLWRARATDAFDFNDFNKGDYMSAVESKSASEIISKVLYPNDSILSGKILRLKQQYFFVNATLQDIIKNHKRLNKSITNFAEKNAIQLNDTHPALAIPDLMRILIDEEGLDWDTAWKITVDTFGYTNHTIVPEALEEWSVSIFEFLLPRHLQIVYEINQRFLDFAKEKFNFNEDVIKKLSIIREGDEKFVRMANLAIIGSHSVNGVAELHTKIIKEQIFKDFYEIFPEKFNNKTNGISPRRFLKQANPLLSNLISEKIGNDWIYNLSELKEIEKYQNDENFRELWKEIKYANKLNLIEYIKGKYNIKINPDSLFDSQVKRFHEYKRQLLNVFHTIHFYNRILKGENVVPRTIIFSGKAAPGYVTAKVIIKLINCVADVVNNDSRVGNKLKVLFLKNYSVSLAERIIPASDLSEQISTAGFEASGTGNMKFALNGALTIGTLDGANIEIKEEVGEENIFIFGLKDNEILELRKNGYNPKIFYDNDSDLKKVIDMIQNNYFNRNEPGIFKNLIDDLINRDFYFLFADFRDYIDTQLKVENLYKNSDEWTRKSILNVSRIGKFSSDRTIKEYADEIWNVKQLKVL